MELQSTTPKMIKVVVFDKAYLPLLAGVEKKMRTESREFNISRRTCDAPEECRRGFSQRNNGKFI